MSDLFILNNSTKNWKAETFLHEWADPAQTSGVATGGRDVRDIQQNNTQYTSDERPQVVGALRYQQGSAH